MDLDGRAEAFQGKGGGGAGVQRRVLSIRWEGCVPRLWGMVGTIMPRRHVERVGLVRVEWDGRAETVGAEEGLEAGEGVGEFVGVTEGLFEELVLGFPGESGSEAQGVGGDGSRGADGVEPGVERAEEDGRVAGGFRQGDGALMDGVVVEGERHGEGGGGGLVGGETGAEGVEAAMQEEEERFEGLERVVEIAGGVEVLRGTMKGEEAVVFAMEDVVEAGGFGAETFGEPLAREGGEVAEGVEAPEVEELVVQRGGRGFGGCSQRTGFPLRQSFGGQAGIQ